MRTFGARTVLIADLASVLFWVVAFVFTFRGSKQKKTGVKRSKRMSVHGGFYPWLD